MIPFDLTQAPLAGVHLIEASAGTGKTYAICGLYGRLVVEAGLGVDQVLVLTFTEAATEELKGRVRDRLRAMDRALSGQAADDPWIDDWVVRLTDRNLAKRRLTDALGRFDQTAIHTIHGFCQRLLDEHAFEIGARFDTEMIGDSLGLVSEVAADFWSRALAALPPIAVGEVMASTGGAEALTTLWKKASADDGTQIVPDDPPSDPDIFDRFGIHVRDLEILWRQDRDAIVEAVHSGPLKGNVYGTIGSKAKPGYTRTDRVRRMVSDMDQWIARRHSLASTLLKKPLINWAGETLTAYTAKGKTPPRHPFFDQMDRAVVTARAAVAEAGRLRLDLIRRFFDAAHHELEKRKADGNVRTYDDLLHVVRDAVLAPGGDAMAAAVRKRYRAALVDEFQDTDPCQYQIIRNLFHHSDGALFMIGDPKQAIYGFRGADVFSYLAAARATVDSATLSHNWRSTPAMIHAVNTLFDQHPDPFGIDRIDFSPVSPAGDDPNRRDAGQSQTDGNGALVVWDVAESDPSLSRLPVAALKDCIADAMAAQIASWTQGAGPPSTTAVLVRSNADAQRVYERFIAEGIGCVLHGAGSVFGTDEAQSLFRLLQAVHHPGQVRLVSASWATDFIDGDPSVWADADHAELQSDLLRFYEYNRAWETHGILIMLRQLMARERVVERFSRWRDGQRRMSNVNHLCELLTAAEHTLAGPSALMGWFGEAIRNAESATGRADPDHRLRLDADDARVQVLTIHQSKGLEFDRVFVPFAWQRLNPKFPALFFHDPTQGARPVLDVGLDPPALHKQWAEAEWMSEELRLFYVAVTRARSWCCLAWLPGGRGKPSAFEHLVSGGDRGETGLVDWAGRSNRSVCIQPLPDPVGIPMEDAGTEASPVVCLQFKGRIDSNWRVSSFSSLTAARHAASPDARDWDGPVSTEEILPDVGGIHALTGFPAGTRTGLCFHEMLETVDWADPDTQHRRKCIESGLVRYGFDSQWAPTVEGLFDHLRDTPLPGPEPPVRLGAVSATDRVVEMEFHLPLELFDGPRMADRVGAMAESDASRAFADRLTQIGTRPVTGFLKGYIDLWFRADGRYYLLDWKSNNLGQQPGDYAPDRLLSAMADHDYLLQYMLYVLALNRHLAQRQTDYRYATDFGGVYYLFLRGLGLGDSPETGVYFDRPDPALIEALDQQVLGAFGEGRQSWLL